MIISQYRRCFSYSANSDTTNIFGRNNVLYRFSPILDLPTVIHIIFPSTIGKGCPASAHRAFGSYRVVVQRFAYGKIITVSLRQPFSRLSSGAVPIAFPVQIHVQILSSSFFLSVFIFIVFRRETADFNNPVERYIYRRYFLIFRIIRAE